jgi:mono/diheme cytochrome c family protein
MLAAAGVAWGTLLSGCAEAPERDPDQWPVARADVERAIPTDDPGEALYRQHCLACHGVDGRGAGGVTGANLASAEGPLRRSDAELLASIRDGRRGAIGVMPAQGALLGEQGTVDVLRYIRRRFGAGVPPAQDPAAQVPPAQDPAAQVLPAQDPAPPAPTGAAPDATPTPAAPTPAAPTPAAPTPAAPTLAAPASP